MKIKGLIIEDFTNYYKPSMFIGTNQCDFKCCIESGNSISMCQNSSLAQSKTIDVPIERLYEIYINNPITHAVVIGGLEPVLQQDDVIDLVLYFRLHNVLDDIVIYTGYNVSEVQDFIDKLVKFKNIIVKFGRYIPNEYPHFDTVLGVSLASNNQHAERIS